MSLEEMLDKYKENVALFETKTGFFLDEGFTLDRYMSSNAATSIAVRFEKLTREWSQNICDFSSAFCQARQEAQVAYLEDAIVITQDCVTELDLLMGDTESAATKNTQELCTKLQPYK